MYIEKQRNSCLKVWELHEGYTGSSLSILVSIQDMSFNHCEF